MVPPLINVVNYFVQFERRLALLQAGKAFDAQEKATFGGDRSVPAFRRKADKVGISRDVSGGHASLPTPAEASQIHMPFCAMRSDAPGPSLPRRPRASMSVIGGLTAARLNARRGSS